MLVIDHWRFEGYLWLSQEKSWPTSVTLCRTSQPASQCECVCVLCNNTRPSDSGSCAKIGHRKIQLSLVHRRFFPNLDTSNAVQDWRFLQTSSRNSKRLAKILQFFTPTAIFRPQRTHTDTHTQNVPDVELSRIWDHARSGTPSVDHVLDEKVFISGFPIINFPIFISGSVLN